jgi:hypothetical protein
MTAAAPRLVRNAFRYSDWVNGQKKGLEIALRLIKEVRKDKQYSTGLDALGTLENRIREEMKDAT